MPATSFLRSLLRRPLLWLLVYSALCAYGLYAVWQIPVEVLPAFDYPQISIIADYPGATAEQLETLVTRPLEGSLLSLPNLENLRSVMRSGVVSLTARFSQHTRATQDLEAVYAALARAQGELPPGVQPYAEVMGNAINEVADYATRIPPGVSPASVLTSLRSNIEPALRALPGVQRIEMSGSGDASLWVQPNLIALQHYGVSAADIAAAVKAQVLLGPSGYLSLGHQDVLLETRNLPETSQALDAIQVPTRSGPVPLHALARVVPSPVPIHSAELLNGQPSVALIVFKQPGASTVPVVREVNAMLQTLANQLPSGVSWVPIYSQAHLVHLIGHDLGLDLLVGGLLAIGVLFWILGLHRSVWLLAVSIPLALVLGIGVLYLAGQSLNLLTFGALSVGIGLFADDGIIVLESIYHRWEQGSHGFEGVWLGLKDIAGPDASGTFTTVAVFVPLLFVGGLAGLFFSPFALALSVALLASLVVSLTLLPLLLVYVGAPPPRLRGSGARFLNWLEHHNQRLLNVSLNRPKMALGTCTILLLVSVAAMVLVPVNFLPLPNEGVLLDSFALPPGTGLLETETAVDTISARFRRDPDVSAVLARIGSSRGTTYTEPSSAGEIQVVLKSNVNPNQLDHVAARLLKTSQLSGVQQSFGTPTLERLGESLSGLPQPFVIQIYGTNLSTLRSISEAVSARLAHVKTLTGIFNSDAYPTMQLQIQPRPAAMTLAGLTPAALTAQLAPALGGEVMAQIPQGNYHLDLYMRLADAPYLKLDGLRGLPIHTPQGFIPLGRLANMDLVLGPNQIRHLDGARSIEILATPLGPLSHVIHAADAALKDLALPPGYRLTFGGLFPQLEHMALTLLVAGGAALLLIVVILLIQFDILRIAGILLMELPLAFTGGALALAISGVGLNATGLVGFLTVIGISLNHGIVLLHRARRNETGGMLPEAAVREAVHVRFRPILLTTLTAVLGMLPTALGFGRGAEPEQGLAIVVVGGLIWSSLLSTNLIPALYLYWHAERTLQIEGGSPIDPIR
ncbi:MAG: efflux RND transporter permease subunit [Gammaproteobacteria bacterium]